MAKKYYILRDSENMSEEALEREKALIELLKAQGFEVEIGVDPKPRRV